MWQLFSVARLRCSNISHVSFFVLALTLGCASPARADTWSAGNVITYTQGFWGGSAAGLIQNNYNAVYFSSGGEFAVGISGMAGFSMVFTSGPDLLAYLPTAGAIGPLTSNLLNPTSTASGAFGGEVSALKLNIDFSDAGITLGTSGIPFGNLVLANFSTLPNLDGLTVRQYLGDVNTLLGGGSSIYTITELDLITAELNGSFGAGNVSSFAQDHLLAPTSVTSTPEPSNLLLLGTGLLGLIGAARRKWLA